MAIWLKYVAESKRGLAKSQAWQHDTLRHIKEAEKKKDTCVWNSIQNRSLVSSGRIARPSQRLQESCKWSHCLISTNTNPTKHMPANTQANREMIKLYPKERSHTAPYFDFIYFMLADRCFVTPWPWVFCIFHKTPLKLVIAVTPWWRWSVHSVFVVWRADCQESITSPCGQPNTVIISK